MIPHLLYPLYLLGALAVAIPIYLHLRRRPPRETQEFSSLMFLSPSRTPRSVRRSRPENVALLVLRALALLLLAAAFARPWFGQADEAAAAARATVRVVMVDASASMRRAGISERVRDELRRLADDAGKRDRVAMFAFSGGRLRELAGFDDWEAAAAAGGRGALAEAAAHAGAPGWSAGDRAGAVDAGVELALGELSRQGASGAGSAAAEVVVISDLAEGGASDGAPVDRGPVSVRFIRAAPDSEGNAGLSWLESSSFETIPRVRVFNAVGSDASEFELRWDGDIQRVHVPAGRSRALKAPAGAAGVTLAGDSGADFDNRLFRADPPPARIRIAFAGPGDGGSRRADPGYFLRRALPDTDRRTIEIVDFADAAEADEPPNAAIICEPLSGDRLDTVAAWANGGATVILAGHAAGSADLLGELLGADVAAHEADVDRYALLGAIAFDHPVMRPFSDARFRDFSKVRFWKHRKLSIADPPGNLETVARFDSGDPAILARRLEGAGLIVVLASGWHPDDSQLAQSSKFVPLLHGILEAGGALSVGGRRQISPGDAIPPGSIGLPAKEAIIVTGPDGGEDEFPAGEPIRVREPGVFSARAAGALEAVQFAVNVAPSESRTDPVSRARLIEAAGGGSSAGQQFSSQPESAVAAAIEESQKSWRWIVAAVIVVLILETVVAGRRRQQAEPSGPASEPISAPQS